MAAQTSLLKPLAGKSSRPPSSLFSAPRLSVFRLRSGVSNDSRVRAFLNFGKKSLRTSSQDAGIYGSQGRDEYGYDDVEQYFNYMGMLATEGSYDKLQEMIDTGLHPVDILLIWAAKENDHPKVAELLAAGADKNVKDREGKLPAELTTSEEVTRLLEAALTS